MANDTKVKILDIEVKYSEAIKAISKYRESIEQAKRSQKDLKKELDDGNISQEKYNMELEASRLYIKQQSEAIAVISKQLQNQIRYENEQEGSLKQLRAQLSNLTAEYDALSEAERKGAKGEELKNHINEITDALKEGEEATQRYYRNVGNYENAVVNALDEMSKKVGEAKKVYENLVKTQGEESKATRDAERNYKALQGAMDATAKAADDMTSGILGFVSGGNPAISMALGIATKLGNVKQAFILAGEGAKILGRQLLVLMANPIVAFLGLVSAAIMVLVRGISSSEENMQKWNVIMAPINRGLSEMDRYIQRFTGVLLEFIQAVSDTANIFLTMVGTLGDFNVSAGDAAKYIDRMINPLSQVVDTMQKVNVAYKAFISWSAEAAKDLPALGGALQKVNERNKEAIDLAKEKFAIELKERENNEENAKAQVEVAKLRQQAKDEEKYTAEDRLMFVKRANALEEEQAARNVELAKRKLEALEKESEWADNDAETNRKLSQLKVELFNAEKEYYLKTENLKERERSINRQIAAEQKQRDEERKKSAKEAAKLTQERIDKEREAVRKYEDEMLKLVNDSSKQRRKQIEITYSREIEDLRRRLYTEKNLTAEAQDAIRKTIEAKEKQRSEELRDLDADISAERIAQRQKEIDLMLAAVKEGTDEEYRIKQEQIQANLDADLAAAGKEITNTEDLERRKSLIREKYAAENARLEKERQEKITAEQAEAIKNRMAIEMSLQKTAQNEQMQMLIERGATENQLQLQQSADSIANLQTSLSQEMEMLANMKQEEGETLEAYNARRAEAEESISEKSMQIVQTEVVMKKQAYESISSAIDAMGEHSKAFAKLSKVLALAEIAINTGKALAAGVAQAQSVPFPANIAAVALTVATVLSNVASAISTVKSAKFAKGGKVNGPGTGTSDSIPAQLSNGEYVVNAQSTKLFEPLLEAINSFRIPVPISRAQQVQQMRDAGMVQGIKTAIVDIHPVVSVVEVTDAQNRVEMIENIDNY